MRREGRHALLLGALLVALVTVLALLFAPVVPLTGPVVPVLVLALLFLGVQYAIFRLAGLRSAADDEVPKGRTAEPDDEVLEPDEWRG